MYGEAKKLSVELYMGLKKKKKQYVNLFSVQSSFFAEFLYFVGSVSTNRVKKKGRQIRLCQDVFV